MDLNEAQKILNKAGYLLEDKYMDEMDKELDQTLLLNKIVDAVKAAGYKKCGIKKDSVYVWPVESTERYCIVIDKDNLFKDTFYCKILDREKHKYAAKYYFTIKGDTYKRNGFGEPPAFYGKIEDIVRPGKEYIEDKIKPGLFKRIFGKKKVEESYKNEIPDDVMELAEEVYPSKKKKMVNESDFLGTDDNDEPKVFVLKLRDDVNGGGFDPYWGYAGEGGEFVETVKEAQKFSDPNDPEIEELYHSCAEDAIMDPTAYAWICEVVNGKAKTNGREPDFPKK